MALRRRVAWAFCGALVAIVALAFVQSSGASASTTPKPTELYEIPSMRTQNSDTYMLDNGQVAWHVYATDVNYQETDGSFQPIANQITDNIGDAPYLLTNTANRWHALFAPRLAQDGAVRLSWGKYSLSFSMPAATGSAVSKANCLSNSSLEADQTLAADNRCVVYRNVLPSVDVAYTVLASALKEDLILRSNAAPATFVFKVSTANVTLLQKDGTVSFVDDTGAPVFSQVPLVAESANGKTGEVKASMVADGSGYSVELSVDKAFLNDPATLYPIVVDPTYWVSGSSYTWDTWCYDADPSYKGYLSTYLRTGKDTTYGRRRSYIRHRASERVTGSQRESRTRNSTYTFTQRVQMPCLWKPISLHTPPPTVIGNPIRSIGAINP